MDSKGRKSLLYSEQSQCNCSWRTLMFPLQTFDPHQEVGILERRLPHGTQAGTITFITWRTWDSIPEKVLASWRLERSAWLQQHCINPSAEDWSQQVDRLGPGPAQELSRLLSARWNEHLDSSHGACVLQRPELAEIVAASLRFFDGQRYELTDYVVMPNHVHLLVAFPDVAALLKQCESWKHFTATRINKALARSGRFWQQDGFDHLVRSPEQFTWLREYIADNPRRASLRGRLYLHFSKLLQL